MGPKRKILGEDLDPYDSICNPIVICKAENHTRKTKNCKHPWCCYGLGEVSNGIWNNDTSKCELISQLGKNYLKYVRRKDVKKNLRLFISRSFWSKIQRLGKPKHLFFRRYCTAV